MNHSPSSSTHLQQSDESFEYDDDDDEDDDYEDDFASGSGFHDNSNFQTDDEDLLRGQGSGDGTDDIEVVVMTTVATDIVMETVTPDSKTIPKTSHGNANKYNYYILLLIIINLN